VMMNEDEIAEDEDAEDGDAEGDMRMRTGMRTRTRLEILECSPWLATA
jgi:hypothetical protein